MSYVKVILDQPQNQKDKRKKYFPLPLRLQGRFLWGSGRIKLGVCPRFVGLGDTMISALLLLLLLLQKLQKGAQRTENSYSGQSAPST